MEEPNILIKTALNDAVQHVNEGLAPTAALKKVANDLDLNPNYIQRVGEALNVALHYKHFKTASDRSAEFEIANIPQAVEDVFTSGEKTAAEYVSENFSNTDTHDTVFNYNRVLSNPVYKKAFLEISEAAETHDSFPTTFDRVYEKSANYIQKLSKQADEAEVSKVAAEISLNEKFSSLCDEFKRDAGYRTAFEEFESQVFAKHGAVSLDYLNLLHKTACANEERGVHDAGYMMFDQCKEARLFDGLMEAAVDMVASEKTASDLHETMNWERGYLKECHTLMGKLAASKEVKHEQEETAEEEEQEDAAESDDPVLEAIKKKASLNKLVEEADPVLKQAMEKESFFSGFGSFLNIGHTLAGPLHEVASEHMSGGIHASFEHTPHAAKPNMTLDNMERKLLLQELMITDPILSKINPAKVARAFEQLLRLSPEISKEKEVVRAELRAMVSSQALSKFDADLLAKTDMSMLKRRIATNEFNAGHTEGFKF